MEKAIKKAIEGGWKPKHSGFKNCINVVEVLESFSVFYPDIESIKQTKHYFEYFLDPLFWQALGKAEGWYEQASRPAVNPIWWTEKWHRFIDHLVEGKDAESFFTNLLKLTK